MPTFQYQSVTSSGEHRNGVLEAPTRADAVRQLLTKGETATSVQASGGRGGSKARKPRPARPTGAKGNASAPSMSSLLQRSGRPSLGQAEMANFMRELATALEAGLPLMQALRTVRKQAPGKAMPVILDHLIERVEQGDPLHAAAKDYGPPFNDMVVGMIRAADASGEMASVLHQLADLLERSVELKREVLGATMYPLIVATLILASAIILVTVLVPRLIEPLTQNKGFSLPWPTEVVLGAADFIGAWWYWCIGLALVAVFGVRFWLSIPANRMLFDRAKLRVPILGTLLRDVAVARFTRTVGTLTDAGLPILDALRITKQTLGNTAMMAAIEDVSEQVTSGKPIADPLERSGLFPPLLIQVVNLGERSGRLDKMLLHAAGAFDRKVNNSLKLFTKALPPALLVVMASLGGFILAAILLPLLELQSMV